MRRTQYGFSPTVILVVINIVVYIYTSYRGGNFVITAENVLRVYGQFNYAVLNLGLWWQLITSMFVHVSIAHLAGNMFFLFIFGLRAEDLFVDSEYYIVYFSSGFAGNFLTLLYPPAVTSAGASGAILGLFGAIIIYLRKIVERSVLGALLLAFLFFFITLSAGTNILAHFGGLVVGLGIGYWLARSRKTRFTYRIDY